MNQLELFEFKNRPWLLLICIPIPFILFLFNFIIYFLFIPEFYRNGFTFVIPMIILYLEMLVLNHVLAKFRYIDSGILKFDNENLQVLNNPETYALEWLDVKAVTIYYAGDNRWNKKWSNLLTKLKVYRRYNNTHWYGFNKLDLRVLDRIIINETEFFVKIKNPTDKNSLFALKQIAESHSVTAEIVTDDLTINFFGRKLKA